MKVLNEKFAKIQSVVNEVNSLGGHIYIVGGSVRDALLGKTSKDLDVVITGVKLDSVLSILGRNGKVKEVGQSFGIIKFVPFGETEDIDVAVPRTERKIGTGYQGFEVTVDHLLPIEADLERRDFTINSIAYSLDKGFIDPFGGIKDIETKTIKMTNEKAFSEDPLRMLRAVQFASRFDFYIDKSTLDVIINNAHLIKEITPERILIEFEKIVSKGSPLSGANWLVETGLFNQIFDEPATKKYRVWHEFELVKTMAEFMTLLFFSRAKFGHEHEIGSEIFRTKMHGDIDTYKAMQAIELGMKNLIFESKLGRRQRAFNIYKLSPIVFDCEFLDEGIMDAIQDFKLLKYPRTMKELAINGNDIMSLGYTGIEVGQKLKEALDAVLGDDLENNKEQLLTFLK